MQIHSSKTGTTVHAWHSGSKQYKITLPIELIVPDLFFLSQSDSLNSLSTSVCLADLYWITNERKTNFPN